MQNKLLNLFLMISLLSVASCTFYKVDSKETTDAFYPPKTSVDNVQYLETVDQPHDVIAQVTVNAERTKTLDDVILKIRREAAILGGDAVTNIRTDASGTWKKLPAQKLIGNAYVRANYIADVIIFK